MNILVVFKCLILFWSGSKADMLTYKIMCGEYKMTSHIGELSYRPEVNMTPSKICRYDFRPDRNVVGSGGIMFYFTELRMSHSCERSYLKFMDGFGGVNGLEKKLCVDNDTLLDKNVFFTTSDNTLGIEYSDPYANISFTIQFSAYSIKDWDCEGYRCPNKLCVPSGYICSSEIRICGAAKNSCSGKKIFGKTMSSKIFVDVLRVIGIAIAVIAGILISKKLFQHRTEYLSKCRNSCEYGYCGLCCYQMCECFSQKCCKKEQRDIGVTMTRHRQSTDISTTRPYPETSERSSTINNGLSSVTAESSSTRHDPEIAERSTTITNEGSSVTIPQVTRQNGNNTRPGVADVSNDHDPPPSYSQLELYSLDNHANTNVDMLASETRHDNNGNNITLSNADSSNVITLGSINIETDSAIVAHGSEEHVHEPEMLTDFSVDDVLPAVPPPPYDEAVDPPLYSEVISHESEYMASI
ncbi:uncharacterized protein LOC127855068 isoform X1 [Dreissena polymorpha]|nr:uncharacterized protein LOC127855068 isoform X1 [Dreissena polymorpha]